MLYDLMDGPPEPGSLLESVFMLLAKRRMESQYFATRLIVESALAQYTEGKNLQESLENYTDSMFPYLKLQRTNKDKQWREALKQWTSHTALSVKPIFRPTDHKKFMSRLKRGAAQVKQQEEARKVTEHRRLA
jgi:hypothetical protein